MGSIGGVAVVLVGMAAMLVGMASAATYNVGEPGGAWDLTTNYTNWVAQKRFHPGDQIVFKYSAQRHDVVEVNKAGYDSCSTSTSIATHTTGNDVIPLTSTGTRYFICGFPGHCTTTGTGNMKIQIDVVQADSLLRPGACGHHYSPFAALLRRHLPQSPPAATAVLLPALPLMAYLNNTPYLLLICSPFPPLHTTPPPPPPFLSLESPPFQW
uniref:Blue copper-binding protein n=1 Tax=Oryza sativa subsp. japonica TaxID=39947 RepID=Q56UT7_ORYSJ|nr:blue copper-binding protein [Oryza sativa Japonica Group]